MAEALIPVQVRLSKEQVALLDKIREKATQQVAGIYVVSRPDALKLLLVLYGQRLVDEWGNGVSVPLLSPLQVVTPAEAATLPVPELQASADLVPANTPAVPLPAIAHDPTSVTVPRGADVALLAEKPEPTSVRGRVLAYMQQYAERSFTLDELADIVGFNAEKQRSLLRTLKAAQKICGEGGGRYRAVVE